MKSFRSVVCVFSGRLDAGVAALLLKNQGYLVTGLVVKNKYESAAVENHKASFAENVCRHLDISLREVELPKSAWDEFTKSAVSEYQRGLSPALDMLYTKHLTFGSVLDYVRKQVGADALATDNYARLVVGEAPIGGFQHLFGSRQDIMEKLVSPSGTHVRLFRGVDSLHDDSQQLCHLSQACLQRALFPLGDFSRAVVLSVANTFPKLPELKDPTTSVISKDLFRKDIEQVLPLKRASVKLYNSGVVIGDVPDIYSIQEGSKVIIDGKTFVVFEKNLEQPSITVVEDSTHGMLKRSSLFVDMASWISRVPLSFLERGSLNCRFASQPQQKLTPCVITMGTHDENKAPDHIVVSTSEPITGAVRGHYVAFYQGEECLGGAQIFNHGPSSALSQINSIEQKPNVDYSNLQGIES